MDEYLEEHFVVKFFVIFLIGAILFICMYLLFKSYVKKELEPTPENSLARMTYWRTIIGMCLGVLVILMAFYMLYEDLTTPKVDNLNRYDKAEVRK
ncbi:hypothetical protein [Chryseobacterium rhizosphaerae]|uniref:hypothetical protein n=1 Tax=Chryseobacterium rhizosphaerae TaxID=395937 RepID=UPI0006454E43|nr:hypothetical protein [Chryseobacterium rhizosphaerae]MDC8100602.1 hypothetical protein [Chryseobacterium rhizosphaerae]